MEYSIFVSATKEIQSNPEQPKESKICKPDPKSLKTKSLSKIQKTHPEFLKSQQKNPSILRKKLFQILEKTGK